MVRRQSKSLVTQQGFSNLVLIRLIYKVNLSEGSFGDLYGKASQLYPKKGSLSPTSPNFVKNHPI
ncbi:hypothetical protein B0E43_02785 [Algoriphagus sp. A40]|nr:hypothetical protein B0E43_02785 [Algoriphagus sp. A40]